MILVLFENCVNKKMFFSDYWNEESQAVLGQFPVKTLHWYGRNSSLFGLDVRKNLHILYGF